jgi:hypothetical protein
MSSTPVPKWTDWHLQHNTSASAKTGNRLAQENLWLNFQGRSTCAACNSRTYLALVGWFVRSFVGVCLVGWTHCSLPCPVCHSHGKLTCHEPFHLQTVKLISFKICRIRKLRFLFLCFSKKNLCHIRVLI